MKHTFTYITIISAVAIVSFSCRKAETPGAADGRVLVKASEEGTKTHVDNYAVLWDSSDETMKLFCAPSAEAVPVSAVSETAAVSSDSKTAEFAFNFSYTDEFTNCFIYGGIYPSGAVSSDASATMSTIEVNLPSEQSPTESAYDPSAFIMVAKPQTFSAKKTEISQYFRRAVALNIVTVKNLAVAQGEKVSSVKFTVPQSLTFSGKRQINLAAGESGEFTGAGNTIQLNYASPFIPSNGTFNAWFTSWNTFLEIGQILTVEVTTDMATYKREITLDKAVSFKEREYNTLTVNMASAVRTVTAPEAFDVSLPSDLEDIELDYDNKETTVAFEWNAEETLEYEAVFSLSENLSSSVSVELNNTGKAVLTHSQLDNVLKNLGVKDYHAAKVWWAIRSTNGSALSGTRSMKLLRFMSPFTDPRDNETYRVVRIVNSSTGDAAVWLADNLRAKKYSDGTAIESSKIRFSEPADGADDVHKEWCRLRGAYYSWAAAVRDTDKAAAGEKVQGIAPEGWHIATREEWIFLINNQPDNTVPAASMRSADYWTSEMTVSCDNASGMNVVSTGYIWNIASDSIIESETSAYFWTSTEPKNGDVIPWSPDPANFPNQACVYSFLSSDNGIAYYVYDKTRGFNVRCVLDE